MGHFAKPWSLFGAVATPLGGNQTWGLKLVIDGQVLHSLLVLMSVIMDMFEIWNEQLQENPLLIGDLEHLFIFHNIWDNPSHWLSYFFRGVGIPPTCFFVGLNTTVSRRYLLFKSIHWDHGISWRQPARQFPISIASPPVGQLLGGSGKALGAVRQSN